MEDFIVEVGMACAWVIILSRLWASIRSRVSGLMWFGIALGTLGVTTGTFHLHARMVRYLGAELTLTIQTLSISISSIILITLVRHLSNKPARTRCLTVAYSSAVALVLLPLVFGAVWESSLHFEFAVLAQDSVTPLWAIHRLAMYGLVATAEIYATQFCIRYARASRGGLSVGLWMIAVGGLLAFTFAAASTGMIVTVATGMSSDVLLSVQAALPTIALLSITATVLGSGIEPAVRAHATRRAWRELRALWHDLAGVVPDITMPGQRGWPTARIRLSLQDRLYRRVMEIKDAILVLRENLPAHYLDTTMSTALVHGTCPTRARVIAEASWLIQAVTNRRANIQYGASAEPLTGGEMTFDEEVQWLREISAEYQTQRHGQTPDYAHSGSPRDTQV